MVETPTYDSVVVAASRLSKSYSSQGRSFVPSRGNGSAFAASVSQHELIELRADSPEANALMCSYEQWVVPPVGTHR